MALARYSGKARRSSYAWRVITNRINSHLRQLIRDQQRLVSYDSLSESALRAEPTQDTTQLVAEALAAMPTELRSVVNLKRRGYTFYEIGKCLGLTKEGARQRWEKGLAFCRSRATNKERA